MLFAARENSVLIQILAVNGAMLDPLSDHAPEARRQLGGGRRVDEAAQRGRGKQRRRRAGGGAQGARWNHGVAGVDGLILCV